MTRQDPASGRQCYVNTRTRQTTWIHPGEDTLMPEPQRQQLVSAHTTNPLSPGSFEVEAASDTVPPVAPPRPGMRTQTQLSAAKMAELREAFDIFDVDGSGTMNIRELQMAMRALGLDPRSEPVEQILARADTDRSGEIDFGEFVAAATGGSQDAFYARVVQRPPPPRGRSRALPPPERVMEEHGNPLHPDVGHQHGVDI